MRRPYHLGDVAASDQPAYKTQEPTLVPFSISLQANEELHDVSVSLEKGFDYEVFSISGSSTGSYELNFRLPSGRMYATSRLERTHLVGTASFPFTLGLPVTYPGGSNISVDAKDLSGAGNTVTLIFKGIRKER